MSLYIGVDPGASGGIAALDETGAVVAALKMPETERDVLEAFSGLDVFDLAGSARAVLEFVRSSPQMGVTSAFSFGRNYGALRMALVAARIPFDEVSPQKWQTAMRCLTKGDKNVSKRRAQELFPHQKVTHATADALLLAEFCRRTHGKAIAGTINT